MNRLTMDELVNVLLAIDKAYSTTECHELWTRLRWVKPDIFLCESVLTTLLYQ